MLHYSLRLPEELAIRREDQSAAIADGQCWQQEPPNGKTIPPASTTFFSANICMSHREDFTGLFRISDSRGLDQSSDNQTISGFPTAAKEAARYDDHGFSS
jgi:hypothetical protein